jgi:hypothetical protein
MKRRFIMMARNLVVRTTKNKCVLLTAVSILISFCLVFSGALYADTTVEPGAETVLGEAVTADATAELEAILKKNSKCLRCHTKDRSKTLEDGTELSLKVHKEDYLTSAHGEVACIGCHEAIGSRKHPSKKTNITIATQREYSLELNSSCRNCHDKKFTQYEGSIHSSLVGQGSEKAPMCTDCHSAHAIESMTVYQPDTGFPCKKCHENIFTAYRESVHGSARLTGNVLRDEHIQAPICSDCHSSHQVTAVEIGDTLRSECFGCHENVPLLHNQWLPNAGKHLDIVSCAVCHAPFAKHKFDLHFFDSSTQAPVGQMEAYEMFQQQLQELEDEGGTVDPLAVWKLIEEGNEQVPSNISLRGRLEVKSGVWAHQIAPKSFAVRTCDSCHLEGHRERMGITMSVPQQDGRVQSFETDREALSSVSGIESMSDFYALGGNTNKLLDIMFLLSLAAGFAVPIGHFTLGRMIKEKIDKGEQ